MWGWAWLWGSNFVMKLWEGISYPVIWWKLSTQTACLWEMACLTLWLWKGCRGEDHTRGTSLQTENSRSFQKALNSEVTGFQEKIVSLEAQEKSREEKRWKVWRGFMRYGELSRSWKYGPQNPQDLLEGNGEGKLKNKDVPTLPINAVHSGLLMPQGQQPKSLVVLCTVYWCISWSLTTDMSLMELIWLVEVDLLYVRMMTTNWRWWLECSLELGNNWAVD